jgi:hypothetical protein
MAERQLSIEFANRVAKTLADNLRTSEFYLTYCHAVRAVHIGIRSGLSCSMCNGSHPWLKITREDAKLLASREIPLKVRMFIDNQIRST